MKKGKMLKRLVGGILSAMVALTAVYVPPGPAIYAEEGGGDSQEKAEGLHILSADEAHSRSGRLKLADQKARVTVIPDGGGVFRTSLVDGSKYITTTSAGESWFSGTGDNGGVIERVGSQGMTIAAGHVYEVRFDRTVEEGSGVIRYSIVYYDVTSDIAAVSYTAVANDFTGTDQEVYVKAVDGGFTVYNCSAEDAGYHTGDREYVPRVMYEQNFSCPMGAIAGVQAEHRATVAVNRSGAFRVAAAYFGGPDGVDLWLNMDSNGYCDYAAGAEGDPIVREDGTVAADLTDHVIEITYTRKPSAEGSRSDYTVVFYDVTDQVTMYTYRAKNTNLTSEIVQTQFVNFGGVYSVYDCSAEKAGYKAGDRARPAEFNLSHGRDRSRLAEEPDNTVPEGYAVNPATQGKAKKGDYDRFFLKDQLQEVRIDISANNLDYVLQNAQEKKSALAESVTIGGETVRYVGLKTKGNYTREHTNLSDSDRFSFTVNFGKYIKKKDYGQTQNFFGVKKISFNNFYFDKTMMKEYCAFRLLSEMGLPTPQYGLAKLYINGEYYGVYSMIENIQESILEQYYGTNEGISDYFLKPDKYSPRYFAELAPYMTAEHTFTWDSLVKGGAIEVYTDGSGKECYRALFPLNKYEGLWERDGETLQDVAKELPGVLTWMYRLTMLSCGKDFEGQAVDVNSEAYIKLLEQILDVDETVRYFAAHSFLVQMDNLFTWRQNYGLYVDPSGKAMVTPWDYDLAWGCDGAPADPENVANWDVDRLYNDVAKDSTYYNQDKASYYRGEDWSDERGGEWWWYNWNTGFPIFNVIYQNKALMDKFHTYVEDCSKIAELGGTTSFGKVYEAGETSAAIDGVKDKVIAAAEEALAKDIAYLQYDQPTDVKKGIPALRRIIALRAVGAWLQVNGIDAKVTGCGCIPGALGNDWEGELNYETGGDALAVVDENTGIFTVAAYDEAAEGPTLSGEKLREDSEQWKAVVDLIRGEADENSRIDVYSLTKNTRESRDGSYMVYLPVHSEDSGVFACDPEAKTATALKIEKCYDGGTAAVKVNADQLSCLAVADTSYFASFTGDEGVDSVDVFYTQNYDAADEKKVDSAKARDPETGNIDITGEGQINFRVNLKEGCRVDSIVIPEEYKGMYKNLKTPAETGGADIYRITKVKGSLSVVISTAKDQSSSEGYEAKFEADEHVRAVEVFAGQDYSVGGTVYSSKSLTKKNNLKIKFKALATDKLGAVDTTGEGQYNLRITTDPGYEIKNIAITGAYYKNLKTPEETAVRDESGAVISEGAYRITKVSGAIEVEIKTQLKKDVTAAATATAPEAQTEENLVYGYTPVSLVGNVKEAADAVTGGQLKYCVVKKDEEGKWPDIPSGEDGYTETPTAEGRGEYRVYYKVFADGSNGDSNIAWLDVTVIGNEKGTPQPGPVDPGPVVPDPDPEPEPVDPGPVVPDPEPETQKPEPETEKSEPETQKPEPETEKSEPETQRSEPETEKSEPETQKPEPETEKSEPETQKPEPETEKSEPETQKPEPETEKSEPETQKPEPETEKSEPETQKSEPETQKPETETQKTESETKTPTDNSTTVVNTDGSVTTTRTETASDGTRTVTSSTVKEDGSTVRTVTRQKSDGTVEESEVIREKDGTVTEIRSETDKSGTVTEKKVVTASTGEKVITESVTEKDGDGQAVEAAIDAKGTMDSVTVTIVKAGKKVEKQSYTVSGAKLSLKSDSSTKKKVSIPGTVTVNGSRLKVTAIAANAFKGSKKLEKVVLGSNVTSVGKNAFKNCRKLKSVTFGKKIKTIGKNVFKGCKKLKTIIVKAKTLKKVAKNAFKGIGKNTTIKIKASKKQYRKMVKQMKKAGAGKAKFKRG